MNEYDLRESIHALTKINTKVSEILEKLEKFDRLKAELEPRIIEMKPRLFCKKCARASTFYELKKLRTKTFDDKTLEDHQCMNCGFVVVVEYEKTKQV